MKNMILLCALLASSLPTICMIRMREREKEEVNDHQIKTKSSCLKQFFADSMPALWEAKKKRAELEAILYRLEHGLDIAVPEGSNRSREFFDLRYKIIHSPFTAYEQCLNPDKESSMVKPLYV